MEEKGVSEKKRNDFTNFHRLIEKLSLTGIKPEVYYERLHQKLENLFRLKGLNQADAAADESLDRLTFLLTDKDYKIEEIDKMAFRVACFVYHEFYRAELKEVKAIDGFRQTISNAEPEAEIEKEEKSEKLRRALEQLPEDERQLLFDYYKEVANRDKWRESLAQSKNQNTNWLRVKILRIRMKLEKILQSEREQ